MLLSAVAELMLRCMKIKAAKTCEACEQPFEADRQLEGRQAYRSMPECQRERRRRSQRRRRAAKSSVNQPSVETSIGGENSSELHAASLLIEKLIELRKILSY